MTFVSDIPLHLKRISEMGHREAQQSFKLRHETTIIKHYVSIFAANLSQKTMPVDFPIT
jgi:hypothetical protein